MPFGIYHLHFSTVSVIDFSRTKVARGLNDI